MSNLVRICGECDFETGSDVCLGDEGWTICPECRTVEGDTYYKCLDCNEMETECICNICEPYKGCTDGSYEACLYANRSNK